MRNTPATAISDHVNTLTIDIDSNFSGRLLLYIDHGVLKAYEPVRGDMYVCALDDLLDIAVTVGYEIRKPDHLYRPALTN